MLLCLFVAAVVVFHLVSKQQAMGLFFSMTRYMIGVGFRNLGHTSVPQLALSYPPSLYYDSLTLSGIMMSFFDAVS